MFQQILIITIISVFVAGNPLTKIINGNEAEPHSIPYQVGIFFKRENNKTTFCGGALISEYDVLTAAHCTNGSILAEVVLGAHHIMEKEPNQIRIQSSDLITHDNYKVGVDDIALIRLPNPVNLTNHINIINLPSREQESESFLNENATISGWGLLSDDSPTISDRLHIAQTTIMDNRLCGIVYLGSIKSSHICTESYRTQGAACDGDSGGPLVVNNILVGLVSFGSILGCESEWPTVYSRVTSYLDWIQDHSTITIK